MSHDKKKSKKDYKRWHDKKCFINEKEKWVFFHEREIWFCHIGENIGFEQDGRGDDFLRPIIILKKFNNDILWCIPLTNVKKKDKPFYFIFSFHDKEETTAILSQIRLIDARRLAYKIGYISEEDFRLLKTKIKQLLA